MNLRNVRINLGSVARTTNSKTLEAINAGHTYKRDDNGNMTREPDTYYIDCAANRGDTLRVKLPLTCAEKITALKDILDTSDQIINIKFQKLELKAYALIGTNGNLVSGVSAKAEDFEYATDDSLALDDDIEL